MLDSYDLIEEVFLEHVLYNLAFLRFINGEQYRAWNEEKKFTFFNVLRCNEPIVSRLKFMNRYTKHLPTSFQDFVLKLLNEVILYFFLGLYYWCLFARLNDKCRFILNISVLSGAYFSIAEFLIPLWLLFLSYDAVE